MEENQWRKEKRRRKGMKCWEMKECLREGSRKADLGMKKGRREREREKKKNEDEEKRF